MTSRLAALCFGAGDPLRLGEFWAGVLGWELREARSVGVELLPSDDTGFRIRFRSTQEVKAGPNQMHFDLTSKSADDQQQTVARALGLGARHIDVGQLPQEGHVVLADPEGNEFCVIEAGNNFLAGCGFVGAVACDGSQEVGQFWSGALGWPLVWDQEQETAIRSPHGGPKITWGGVPALPSTGENRLQFELVPAADGAAAPEGDWQAEVERLVSIGAGRVEQSEGHGGSHGRGEAAWVLLTDPDGNEFRMLINDDK